MTNMAMYRGWAITQMRFALDIYDYYVNTLTDEQWQRTGQHPKRGPFSLNDQLMLTTHHDMLHLNQITKILTEKPS